MLEVLPQEVSDLEKKIIETTEALSDPDLYTQNPSKFDELSSLLPKLQEEKEYKENLWLELCEL